ncbi:cyclase family protein [Acuticoccus yangtzensis]|uniref:cyclase family protein n=1 Tax=Acuticoccus yangtzensis TaxID=1443441 RepID=UPI0009495F37|nr:hypothetical protein ATO13_12936 [Stappia sp. 22II-S9-Z10]
MDNPRWVRRPEGANWGEFSPDDQLGRLNLITAEKVLQGVAEVREGRVFSLSLPLDYPGGNALNPRRHPPVLRPTLRDGNPNYNCVVGDNSDVVCDDLAIIHLQYSTQWDALCHVGSQFDADGDGVPEKVYYNGFRGGEDIVGPAALEDCGPGGGSATGSTSAARKLGIEGMAAHGVQGRGVMIDLRAHFGDARRLVTYADIAAVMEADAVTVEPGDMVCLHTGFAQRVLEMKGAPDPDLLHDMCAALDGRDQALLDWVSASGLSVLIADNYAVEGLPANESHPGCARMPLHEHCLFKNGIHLGELWHLTPLAEWLRAAGRSRFLLTAPPLRLPGAVGSPANPIATV